uniref:PHD-type domain-containing protein n=1 Tax=Macrostomum lignano TaxID=282301 RepID=A0A1I8FPM1_9PLAT
SSGCGSTPLDCGCCGRSRRRRRSEKSPVVASRAPSASSSSYGRGRLGQRGGGGGAAASSANSPDLVRLLPVASSANRMGVPSGCCAAGTARTSCMLYGPELAARACQSPWQCSECKTCCVCSGSGDPELILICDACDKGYHLPPARVTERPASDAKWVCSRCREEERVDGSGQQPPPQESQAQLAGDASLWSIAQVRSWLDGEGFPLAAQACVEQEIDGASLMLMKRMDVLTGLGLKLGPAVKVFDKISRLQGRCRTLLAGQLKYLDECSMLISRAQAGRTNQSV